MAFRQFVRGTVEWERLEAVALELADRYDREEVHVTFLDADNWLSTPCVVDGEFFVKVISPQNSLVHAIFTAGRNLGAFTSGTEGFFDHVGSPVQMAEREFEATQRMREVGLNAPEPLEVFEVDGLGVLVSEFLSDFRTLDDLSDEEVREVAPTLFETLARLHDEHLAHGDLRGENVLLSNGDLYFIDATTVKRAGMTAARAYDLACALGVLEPRIGARAAVEAALDVYDADVLIEAREFVDFAYVRPDLDFDAPSLKGELEKAAA